MKSTSVIRTAKPWGANHQLFQNDSTEVHHATIHAGGKSSLHHHEHKTNLFYIVSGTLKVWCENGVSYTLGPHSSLVVFPGHKHQFEAVTDVELIEIYAAIPPTPNDIIRQ